MLKGLEAERAAKQQRIEETPKKGQATKFYTFLIEEHAKLESTLIRYRDEGQAVIETVLDFESLGDEDDIKKKKGVEDDM